MTPRERIAREALERIAERGVVVFSHIEIAQSGKPPHQAHRCPACKTLQDFSGACANRDCLTFIARAALDDMRSAS